MDALQETHSLRQSQASLLWNLPTEIVIEIMKCSVNFSCLWSLINASSRFKSIFMAIAWEVVEGIMIKTTPICTQALMKIVMITRTSPALFIGVNDVVNYMSREKPFRPFPRGMSPQVLHDIVELAHNIHAVAHFCLDFYVERSLSIKLQKIGDRDREDWRGPQFMLYSEHELPGGPFRPKEFGPPTYLEEQICIRVLWRMQVSLDMKAAGRTGRLAHWSEEDCNYLAMADFHETLRPYGSWNPTPFPSYEEDQILTVIDFVKEITGNQHDQTENLLTHFLHHPPMVMGNNGYHLHCLPKPAPTLKRTSSGKVLVDIDSGIEKRTMGWLFYQIKARMYNYKFQQVTFKPYRKFGFAFWEPERMIELRLLGPKTSRYGFRDSRELWSIWRSILISEEDAERYTGKC